MSKQLTLHNLVNLKKKMEGLLNNPDCEYSKKIMAVINEKLLPVVDECIVVAKEISKKKDKERRDAYQFEDITCEDCGKEYMRAYIYQHRKDKHGAVSSKPKKENAGIQYLKDLMAEFKADGLVVVGSNI